MEIKRKKVVWQDHEMDDSCVSPEFHPIYIRQTELVVSNLFLSLLINMVLLQHDPPSETAGNPVQDVIFQGYPSVFEAFVICIIFSFIGSFCWLLMRNIPKVATFRRCYFIMSMLFMAAALSILAAALFLQYLRLVSPGSRLWNPENFSFVSLRRRLWNPENFRLVSPGCRFWNPENFRFSGRCSKFDSNIENVIPV